MKKIKLTSIISILICLALIIFLINPVWLPLPAELTGKMLELRDHYFLVKGESGLGLANILMALLAILIMWFLYMILKLLLTVFGRKNSRAMTVNSLLAQMLKYVAVIVAIIWVLSILGVNMGAVLAGVGIIGLVLGLGAQSLVEDVLTGIFIIFEGQYKIGDIIILDDFRGEVKSIGVRTTTIEDVGGNLKIVNNSDIRNLQNRSKNKSYATTLVAVEYGQDIQTVEKVFAEEFPKLYKAREGLYLKEPEYMGVEELSESSLNLLVRVLCDEEDIFVAKRRLAGDLYQIFMDHHITIPYNKLDVTIMNNK